MYEGFEVDLNRIITGSNRIFEIYSDNLTRNSDACIIKSLIVFKLSNPLKTYQTQSQY